MLLVRTRSCWAEKAKVFSGACGQCEITLASFSMKKLYSGQPVNQLFFQFGVVVANNFYSTTAIHHPMPNATSDSLILYRVTLYIQLHSHALCLSVLLVVLNRPTHPEYYIYTSHSPFIIVILWISSRHALDERRPHLLRDCRRLPVVQLEHGLHHRDLRGRRVLPHESRPVVDHDARADHLGTAVHRPGDEGNLMRESDTKYGCRIPPRYF